MVNKLTISAMIRSRSSELGMSDAEVARRCNIEYRNYAHYASGNRTPPYDALYKIGKVLNLTPNDFFSIKPQYSLDSSLLERIITALEMVVSEQYMILSPSKKAKVIILAYDHAANSNHTDDEIKKQIFLIIRAIESL